MVTRIELLFSGRVQGVGFRATVARLATDFAVVGRVSNLSDGRVELLAEGEKSELLAFRAAVFDTLDRYMVDHIEKWSEPCQTWQDFRIGSDKYVPARN